MNTHTTKPYLIDIRKKSIPIDCCEEPLTLKNGVIDNPEIKSSKIRQLFFESIVNEDLDVMADLLHAGVNINTRCDRFQTPLINAITQQKYSAASFLLDNGADPNQKGAAPNTKGYYTQKDSSDETLYSIHTPLEHAVLNNYSEIIPNLLENGSIVTAMILRIGSLDPKIFSELISTFKRQEDRSIINDISSDGKTPLMENAYYIYEKDDTNLKLLLSIPEIDLERQLPGEKSISCTEREFNALSIAARGNYQFTKTLLEAGADPNALSADKRSTLQNVITRVDRSTPSKDDIKIVKVLLDHDADPDLVVPYCSYSNRYYSIVSLAVMLNSKLSPLLIERSKHLGYVNPDGDNLLHLAVLHENEENISLLLDKDVPHTAKNRRNNTPIDLLIERNRGKLLERFIDHPKVQIPLDGEKYDRTLKLLSYGLYKSESSFLEPKAYYDVESMKSHLFRIKERGLDFPPHDFKNKDFRNALFCCAFIDQIAQPLSKTAEQHAELFDILLENTIDCISKNKNTDWKTIRKKLEQYTLEDANNVSHHMKISYACDRMGIKFKDWENTIEDIVIREKHLYPYVKEYFEVSLPWFLTEKHIGA